MEDLNGNYKATNNEQYSFSDSLDLINSNTLSKVGVIIRIIEVGAICDM